MAAISVRAVAAPLELAVHGAPALISRSRDEWGHAGFRSARAWRTNWVKLGKSAQKLTNTGQG
jgi:hypothetical protein